MTKSLSLEERLEIASDFRKAGYNCAQSVLMAFPDITGLDNSTAARASAALGSGVAGLGDMCGVVTGMGIAVGMTGGDSPADKVKAAALTKRLAEIFASHTSGRLCCRDLKKQPQAISCNDLVALGVRILHQELTHSEK